MGKSNARVEAARRAYREALEQARATPTAEAWGRLLAAGKALSSAEEPKPRGRRPRRPPPGPYHTTTDPDPEPADGTVE